MAITVSSANKEHASNAINNLEAGQAWTSWIPFVGQIANAGMEYGKQKHENYLDDVDLVQGYNEQLSSIEAGKVSAQASASYYQGLISDLQKQKEESEEWLEDYRQMLAGEGDDDNLLLAQDQYNQQQVQNSENELASYKDASILELDSLITEGVNEFKNRRQAEALQSVYASASGSVIGAHNNAAKTARAAIKAFAGNDMRFNETGAESLEEAGGGVGSYAKMMVTARQTVRDNTNRLQSAVDAANLAFMSFRDETADVAEENEQFLEDYDDTLANYQAALNSALNAISSLESAAEQILADVDKVVADMNEYEEAAGLELTKAS